MSTSTCDPGVRQREYVYVWKSPSVPEVLATPSILTLISLAQVCVVSVTGYKPPPGQLGGGEGDGEGGGSEGGEGEGGGGEGEGGEGGGDGGGGGGGDGPTWNACVCEYPAVKDAP